MGWYISHDGTRYGFSYNSVAEFRGAVEKQASWSQKRALRPILARRSGDPFSIGPKDAKAMGDALLAVAGRLSAEWAAMARQIGDSAVRAAKANEPWRWS